MYGRFNIKQVDENIIIFSYYAADEEHIRAVSVLFEVLRQTYERMLFNFAKICTHQLKNRLIMIVISEKEQIGKLIRKISDAWLEAMKLSGFSDDQVELFKKELKKRNMI